MNHFEKESSFNSTQTPININKVQCVHCTKYFSNKSNLKTHIQTIHHQILPYICTFPNCNKKYANKSRYNVHIRTHLGIKPFNCNICGQTFNERGNLKSHQLKHDNINRFQCTLCDKSYKSKGRLKEHVNIVHHNVKRYCCEVCYKRFGKKQILTEHLRVHTKEKPFKCPFEGCCKAFAERGNMKIHYKKHVVKKEKEEICNSNSNNNSNSNSNNNNNNNTISSAIGEGVIETLSCSSIECNLGYFGENEISWEAMFRKDIDIDIGIIENEGFRINVEERDESKYREMDELFISTFI